MLACGLLLISFGMSFYAAGKRERCCLWTFLGARFFFALSQCRSDHIELLGKEGIWYLLHQDQAMKYYKTNHISEILLSKTCLSGIYDSNC